MFIYREGDPTGTYLIPQVSHAWLAWQVALHWGNRSFARPAPVPETLAAVLLHDCGWSDYDESPTLDAENRPRAFDSMPVAEHLAIWRKSVSRCAQYNRYAGLLVAAHFGGMAERKLDDLLERGDTAGARLAQTFAAEMEGLERAWREGLGADARYQAYLSGPGRQVNARLLDACDRISVFLCASLPSPFDVRGERATGETEIITFETVDDTTWRVHPWPLQGERLRLQCEGRRLATSSFATLADFQETIAHAPTVRLVFTLLRASAVG